MRQRKARDLEERLRACAEFMTEEPAPGIWESIFGDKRLYLEIGCGKGSFIIKKALSEPESAFIAVEGQETVMLRALERAKASEGPGDLRNLRFVPRFIDRMDEFFAESSLEGIYLNFSDPWPKARHAKRRLTYRKRLEEYIWALRPGGAIEVKTDNDDLFVFTLNEAAAVGMRTAELTRDLHSSGFDAARFITEYEEKFMSKGKNINYVKLLCR